MFLNSNIFVECYCFLINIIVVGVEPRRDALVYAPWLFFFKISIGLVKRLDLPIWVRCCCWPFPVKVSHFRAFWLYIKTSNFDPPVKSRRIRHFLCHGNAKKLFSSTRRWFFLDFEQSRLRAVVLFEFLALFCVKLSHIHYQNCREYRTILSSFT